MNQGSNEAPGPGLNLPPPRPEQMPGAGGAGVMIEQQPGAAEQTLSAPEQGNRQSRASAAVAASLVTPGQGMYPAGTDASGTTAATASASVDDKDLIDKAVVDKAKAIIARTRNDPYLQTQEISGLRAEFMQQNYNKPIKLEQ